MKLVNIKVSNKNNKKYIATFQNTNIGYKYVYFGVTGYNDFTDGASVEHRQRYLNRHSKSDDLLNPTNAETLARYILWGESKNIYENINEFKERFNL